MFSTFLSGNKLLQVVSDETKTTCRSIGSHAQKIIPDVLFETDRYVTAFPMRPGSQRKMVISA